MASTKVINARASKWLWQRYDLVERVEKWNPATQRTNDLFEAFDFLAVGGGETVGVQVTSRTNRWSRWGKMAESIPTAVALANGWKVMLLYFWQEDGPRTKWHAAYEWLT